MAISPNRCWRPKFTKLPILGIFAFLFQILPKKKKPCTSSVELLFQFNLLQCLVPTSCLQKLNLNGKQDNYHLGLSNLTLKICRTLSTMIPMTKNPPPMKKVHCSPSQQCKAYTLCFFRLIYARKWWKKVEARSALFRRHHRENI
jgi:hypothetical protein